MDILERLKQETAAHHRSVETVVPLTRPGFTLEEYAGYLDSLVPFYLQLESRLRAVKGLNRILPDLTRRWKSADLAADLRALGRLPAHEHRTPELPATGTIPQALGALYVLEGSTLGGRILTRLLQEKLGGQVEGKTRFLASYGAETGAMWRSLGDVLRETLRTQREQDEAIRAAQSTFTCFENWLRTVEPVTHE